MIPDGIVASNWPRVERRLNEAGLFFDPWQRGLNTITLGYRDDGKYAATVGGVCASIPRQTGKTYDFGGMFTGLCLEFPGYRVAWTSHHNRTTTNTFRTIQGIVRRKSIFPHVARNGIRTANGEQEIRFCNGSIFMFGAREQGFGRGIDGLDALMLDEAQILALKALEDMVPATNQARHPHGALIVFAGTPPRPTDPGEAFTAKREQAISGRSKDIAYVELGADPDSHPDDRSQYPIMNPSYPLRTPLESMLRMRANIPDDDAWNREARGIWPAVSVYRPVVSPAAWREMFDIGPVDDVRPAALGVDMSHARDISVGACWIEGDSAHIEEVWADSDPAAAVEWIMLAAGRRVDVVIDGASPAMSLVAPLRSLGVRVHVSTATDMAASCGEFEDRASTDMLTHGGQDAVTESMCNGRKRLIRDAGGWGWDRRDPNIPLHHIVSVTLALGRASKTHRARSSRVRKAVTG